MVLDWRWKPQHVHRTVKHDGGSMIIGGAWRFLAREYGTQLRVGWIGHLYKFILVYFLWSTIQNKNLDPSRLVFQHDRDSSTQTKTYKNGWHHNRFNSFNGLHELQIWIPLNKFGQSSKWRLKKSTTPPRAIMGACVFNVSQVQSTRLHGALEEHATKDRCHVEVSGLLDQLLQIM